MISFCGRIGEVYEEIRREDLPDIHAEGILLEHRKSGARVALLPCEDNNKVFNIAFRTPPADSTGVAHIIEHTVLCGSREFPLKDPFVELVKGSMNTFLNAMTFPDKTMYPVASTNEADFRNLMHVYLDAVFFPNIYRERNIFRQEGWHYELTDPDGPLTINGVVYNEMKGAFSSPDDVLEREMMNCLFPATSYGVESGGDPEVIPDLTYEQYLDFHRRYYHPSNSYIVLYGDADMEDALDFLDAHYLSKFDRIRPDSGISYQAPFRKQKTVTRYYPVTAGEEDGRQTFLKWSAVCGNPSDVEEMIAFEALDYALLSAPGAPVRQALLDAGIGMDVYGEFTDGILQPFFSVVAKYAGAGDADRFHGIIRGVLSREAEQGVNPVSLEAALNSLEFQFREADYSVYPKGLMYAIRMMDTWLYRDDEPFTALMQLDAFAALRKKIKEGYFETLIREKLLDNPHSALLVLSPRAGMQEERERALAEKLAAFKSGLSFEEVRQIADETRALAAWQDQPDSPEAVASLPFLKRSDIRKEAAAISNIEAALPCRNAAGEEVSLPEIRHEAPSNGIGYAELLFDVKRVPEDMIPYLGLLRSVLLNVDTDRYTYMDLNNAVNVSTGGISAGIVTSPDPEDGDGYRAFFALRGKSLYSRLDIMADLMTEVMTRSHFDDGKRIREMISQVLAQLQMTLQQAGHSAAALRASACLFAENAFQDLTGGIAYYRFIEDLDERFDEEGGEICRRLAELAGMVFRPGNLTFSWTAEREHLGAADPAFGKLASALAAQPASAGAADGPVSVKPYGRRREGFITPGQVQFVSLAGDFSGKGIPYSGAMAVFRQIMSYEYLWQNIRVRGGAYGCGGSLKRNGNGVFTSYRDPNLLRTKDVFLRVPDYLEKFDADGEEMTKYVIGTVSGLDTPMTPSMLGTVSMRSYLSGITQEMLQKTRDEVLSATAGDIRALKDAARAVVSDDCFCVIGSESAVREAADAFDSVETLI